jgi:redox-sensitive bicupin YhaK (pirin superfamily)
MSTPRPIRQARAARPTLEGAGVHLHRAFGSTGEAVLYDPFLLLDDFRTDDPKEFVRGFPWHPHRGIETVTYMLTGRMRHGDSLGNRGTIGPGDLQWMSAGGGIVHEEMPERSEDGLGGFQLWVNLPRALKTSAPRYQELAAASVPTVERPDGTRVRVLAGAFDGVRGPVRDVAAEPLYLDVTLPLGGRLALPVPADHTLLCYVTEGAGTFAAGATPTERRTVLLMGPGDTLEVEAGVEGCRFLAIAGRPLNEPIAWRGPIVMNTEEELDQAFRDYREGTFLKTY